MNKCNLVLSQVRQYWGCSTIIKRSYVKKSTSNETSIDYCAKIVKQHDYENFLATLLMNKSLRTPAFVVRAFNVEVARIQDQTTDPQTAVFRLQFWHDAIKEIYKSEQTLQNIPSNPIVQELFKVCCCYGLHRRYLERLITSRSNLIKSKYFRGLEDVERYAEESVSSVYYLLLSMAGVANVHADHVASHLGKAQGIANILRSIHVSNKYKVVFLPMDILMKHQVSQENVLRGLDSEELRNAVFDVASRANSHLQKARSIEVPKNAKQIFLPAISINKYLTQLQKCHFNIYDPSLLRSSPLLACSLYFNRLINKF